MSVIDKDEFLHELCKKKEKDCYKGCEPENWDSAFAEFEAILKNVPTVDAEPVRHGHWITGSCFSQGTYDYPEYDKKCSVCEKYSRDFSNYCPNCGAKMDEDV